MYQGGNLVKNCQLNFEILSQNYPLLERFLNSKKSIDFKDKKAVRELCYAILHVNFHLYMEIPLTFLSPTIPNRLLYLEWIHEILFNGQLKLRGLDIGTGASCIYPLLGVACFQDTFIATESNVKSVECAQWNIESNSMQDSITLIKQEMDAIFPCKSTCNGTCNSTCKSTCNSTCNSTCKSTCNSTCNSTCKSTCNFSLNFTMCNPPFYASHQEHMELTNKKAMEPFMVCTGAEHEMYTMGGESQFLLDMYKESIAWKDECQWFTSLIGRKSTLNFILKEFKQKQVKVRHETLRLGRTSRWVIAWTFIQ